MHTVKKILSCVREYKKPSILAPIFIALEVLVECCIPYLTADLINYINPVEGQKPSGVLVDFIYGILGNLGLSVNETADLKVIFVYGVMLFIMAALSMTFGALSAHY